MLAVPEVEVRKIVRADMDSIVSLEEACFDDPYPRYFLEQLATDDRDTFLVAVLEGRIVGYAVVDRWEDNEHLVSIGVHPEWRRRGIAQRLLSSLERLIQSGRPMKLEVREGNFAAVSFYHKNGFRRIGTEEKYYRDGENAVLMEKHP